MKTLWTLLFFIFFSGKIFSQAYVPLNLDTSCVWVHDFSYYEGFNGVFTCNCELTTYVEKDTLINGFTYFKLKTYATSNSSSFPSEKINECNWKLQTKYTFIREDTLLKKIFKLAYDTVAVDFGLQINDTVNVFCTNGASTPVIDSVTIENFNGINRLCKWTTTSLMNPYRIIEGIGAEMNFPLRVFGEFCIPAYYLKCYKKNGITLYPNNPIDSCIKGPFVPVGIKENYVQNLEVIFANNGLKVENPKNEMLKITIFDMLGQVIYIEKFNESHFSKPIDCMATTGIYILRVDSKNETMSRKIVIN